MSTAGPAHITGPLGQGFEVSMMHAESIVRGVLHQHRPHLLQDALRDLVLLVLGIVTRVLHLALQGLLLLLDLLYQRARLSSFSFSPWVLSCFFRALDFVILTLELGLLGLELLAQSLEIALAFVGGENGLLDIDGSDPGSGGVGGAGGRGIVGCGAGGCGQTRQSGPGPQPTRRTQWA